MLILIFLEINIINSVAGGLVNGELINKRPFLDPHHSCSMVAMVGGGTKPKPGQISLAHNGILFLDEIPEFSSVWRKSPTGMSLYRQVRAARLACFSA